MKLYLDLIFLFIIPMILILTFCIFGLCGIGSVLLLEALIVAAASSVVLFLTVTEIKNKLLRRL